MGRAPCTKETLPDFREWCRVTRHPRVFCGLTGCQGAPGKWGVTELGLRLAWILFWFGLELSSDKDQKCVKRHVGILGKCCPNFPKTCVFCFCHNLAYESLIWMILVGDET